MTSRLRQRSLYFITPSVSAKLSAHELVAVVRDAIQGGADLIQWRQKPSKADLAALPELRAQWEQQPGDAFLLPIAKEIRALTKQLDVPFIVNDSVELALQLDADGVHIGQGDSALDDVRAKVRDDFIIGVTVRDGIQARAACERGATYLGAGPVFTSSTKPEANDGNAIGIPGLLDCTTTASAFGVPVYAIGGISVESGRIRQCIVEGGASGLSMIAAIGNAQDKTAAALAIKDELAAAHASGMPLTR